MLWFGYGGYDCPNIEVAGTFNAAGLRVVVVADRPATEMAPGVAFQLPLSWRMPDAGAPLPFPPGAVAPTASVDMAIHYLWLRRLVGVNGERGVTSDGETGANCLGLRLRRSPVTVH